MHRSGTSLLTRSLNICGLNLGKYKELIPPGKGNETGHWEHIEFNKINKELINMYRRNLDWLNIPNFPKNFIKNKEVSHLITQAKILVKKMNNKYTIWGWKDPRNCFTIPFWKHIIKRKIVYIVPLRSSLKVADSLAKRDGFPKIESIDLWKESLYAIYKNTDYKNTYFFNIDNIFINPKKELIKIIKFIDSKQIFLNKKRTITIKKFIDPNLWHFSKKKLYPSKPQEDTTKLFQDFFINELHSSCSIAIQKIRKLEKK